MKTQNKSQQEETLFPILENEKRWETRGIFSEHYLRSRLTQSPLWPKDDYAKPIYDFVSELWKKRYIGLVKANEEVTRQEFLDKVLEKLGFAFFPNLDLPQTRRRQVPDYLLFEDEETKDRVFDSDDKVKYQNAIALLEAKKVNRNLDEVSNQETPGKFPHQQIQDYLRNAADETTGYPYFKWAILTNGKVWRLYCRDAHPSSFFEFKLIGPQDLFCEYDEFKTFLTLFQPQVFVKKDGRCALDDIREQAVLFQNKLEEDLKERIFKIIADLANGFWRFKDNHLTEADLPQLYDNCLIFLYRLLFVLYAEGRSLLPVKLTGVGSNKNYRERYSLQRFIPKLKKGIEYQSDEFSDLYEELLKLFHLINGDKPPLNKECNVPRYNGGLFNPTLHPKLEEWRVGEKSLAQVLKDLIFSAGHKEQTRQPSLEFGTIDYADLEVRQLGDIYEGLLGGHLELDGKVLVPKSERGALQVSGTFYTPDWVVRFLVEKTLKPLIDEIQSSTEVQNALNKFKKDNSFALSVLKLNVLDNAMGSGHFLVRATEWLADQIVYHPTTKFKMETAPKGISQEQAEISYWRRRVVEASIYGVDNNPLAVELTKLSLWLTCIAVDEPLNFLDHHLRVGNSLIGASLQELSVLPEHQENTQIPFTFGKVLIDAVSDSIKEIAAIEEAESTEIDIVKKKEDRWRNSVLIKLEPFKSVANLWIANASGLELNESEYNLLADGYVNPPKPRSKEHNQFIEIRKKIQDEYQSIVEKLHPFHWELEFPDVFFEEDGKRKENPGFDAILGNPPYISTQTSSGFDDRPALQLRYGFIDDLYVHFTFQGFNLLRTGGMFGYIISDTFFTITSKLRLRKLLQNNRIFYLGQCNPFTATLDAAIFVAEKKITTKNYFIDFIQARYAIDGSIPEKELPELAVKPSLLLLNGDEKIEVNNEMHGVLHGTQGCLRLHRIGVDAYRQTLKSVFFEPTHTIIGLHRRFNKTVNVLNNKWWGKIETSSKFDKNKTEILQYHSSLQEGDITLVGLIAEGAQGLGTGNNGKYLGFLEDSESAKTALVRRHELTMLWKTSNKYSQIYQELLDIYGSDFDSIAEQMKTRLASNRESWLGQNVGFKRGEVYRIVEKDKIFPVNDLTDEKRKTIIYEGIDSRRCWLPYSKGDKEGNKWTNIQDLFINWRSENLQELKTLSTARWQGHKYFLKSGVTWSDTGNHVALKSRIAPISIYDVSGMRLNPIIASLTSFSLLAVLNSNVFSFFIKKFIDHTQKYQINDIRQTPVVIPTKKQSMKLDTLAMQSIKAKELMFQKQDPLPDLIKYCRQLANEQKGAPSYLQPRQQLLLLDSSEDCLNALELSVQWEVEKLYGVEGMGPFDEF